MTTERLGDGRLAVSPVVRITPPECRRAGAAEPEGRSEGDAGLWSVPPAGRHRARVPRRLAAGPGGRPVAAATPGPPRHGGPTPASPSLGASGSAGPRAPDT